MKIEICEDNGCLNDGIVTLVVLVITTDDGKQVRVPYQADSTIQQLYRDVYKLFNKDNAIINVVKDIVKPSVVENDNGIGREDIVQCVQLEKDLDGNTNPDLVIGNEYRVVGFVKNKGVVVAYEVMDDVKGDKIRRMGLPKEFKLVRKFVPPPPRLDAKKIIEMQKNLNEEQLASLV